MVLLIIAGIICTVIASSPLDLGLGLLLLTVGSGGVSAGLMAREPGQAGRKTKAHSSSAQ
jgi:hypothetical protein